MKCFPTDEGVHRNLLRIFDEISLISRKKIVQNQTAFQIWTLQEFGSTRPPTKKYPGAARMTH